MTNPNKHTKLGPKITAQTATHTFRPSFSFSASFLLGFSTSCLYLTQAEKLGIWVAKPNCRGADKDGLRWWRLPYLLMVFLVMIFFTAANLGPLLFDLPIKTQTLISACTWLSLLHAAAAAVAAAAPSDASRRRRAKEKGFAACVAPPRGRKAAGCGPSCQRRPYWALASYWAFSVILLGR
jgi:hypothetical protein